MRSYDVGLISLTIGQSRKWVDNLLSHHRLPGVGQGRQGVARRINEDGLLAIELCRLLSTELGIPLARAAHLAIEILSARSADVTTVRMPSGIVLSLDLGAIERRLNERVVEAIDAVALVRRGRPSGG